MTFPLTFHLFGFDLPAHTLFDVLAYTAGGLLFRFELRRNRSTLSTLSLEKKLWLLACGIFGAAVGAKLLAWLEDPDVYLRNLQNVQAWIGGKTLVGGLLGGWIGIEIAKRVLKIRSNTGDAFVLPLIVGIMLGRIGCFLTGLPDRTYGIETNLPWGIDFGDGVHRHPTQLYEIVWVGITGAILFWVSRSYNHGRAATAQVAQQNTTLGTRSWHPDGLFFRLFILSYLSFRFFVEFIKPSDKPFFGLSAIQIASLLGAIVALVCLVRLQRPAGHEQR